MELWDTEWQQTPDSQPKPGSRPLCKRRRGLPTPQQAGHSGETKPTYISVQLAKNLQRQDTPSTNSFWTTNTGPESTLVRRQMGEGECDGQGGGEEPQIPPLYCAESAQSGRTSLKGWCRKSSYNSAWNPVLCVIYLRRLRGKYPWVHQQRQFITRVWYNSVR